MHFKFSCEVVDLLPHLTDARGMEFNFDSPVKCTVQIGATHQGGQRPSGQKNAVSAGVREVEIGDQSIKKDIELGLVTSFDGINANFRCVETQSLWTTIDPIFKPLRDLVETTVTTLRWRSGLSDGPVDPFTNRREFLSLNGREWLEVSMVRSLAIHFLPGPRPLQASSTGDVIKFVSQGLEEPLGHQLFREAKFHLTRHPRSALVIAVAAAEVALKKLVGSLVPHAKWLADEIPMPSLQKIIRKFLPTLPLRAKLKGKTIELPSQLVNTLNRAVECRNKVVHTGQEPPDDKELTAMLEAINDFLWVCDLYSGALWAAGFISATTVAAWKDEP